MKIKNVRIKEFRRFENLEIADLPPAKLVVLAGPNGSGKSSLFDAFSVWRQAHGGSGLSWDEKYHARKTGAQAWASNVEIDFHGATTPKKAFYLRTAYRNDPAFSLSRLQRQGDVESENPHRRMVESETAVSGNYQRLASDAFEDVFQQADGSGTVEQFREGVIGDIRDAVLRLFPDLKLNTLGNPLNQGTFRFDKGSQKNFDYTNLSGGEKAAFDLILDMVVKRKAFDDTVFGIDEPETHMNSRLQGALLEELLYLLPDNSQLWIATHSIGMMRKARELHAKNPADVVFLDFGGQDFDQRVVLTPIEPNRSFWERVLNVALDDLAELVAPSEIVLCEGNPKSPVKGKNEEHDALCYETIFAAERPDTAFISAGSSKEVAGDRLRFAMAFKKLAKGVDIRRLIDRDDHAPTDVATFGKEGIRVLRRRNIESYLYDDEVLKALYEREARGADFPNAQAERLAALADSHARGNAPDDLKSAAGRIYTFLKSDLKLTACGNDQQAFARNTLAPLLRPGMTTYAELKEDILVADRLSPSSLRQRLCTRP